METKQEAKKKTWDAWPAPVVPLAENGELSLSAIPDDTGLYELVVKKYKGMRVSDEIRLEWGTTEATHVVKEADINQDIVFRFNKVNLTVGDSVGGFYRVKPTGTFSLPSVHLVLLVTE